MGKKGRKKIKRTETRKDAPVTNPKNTPAPKFKRPENKSIKLQLSFFLGILAFILYANTLKNDFAYDDQLVITRNTQVQQGIQGIPEIMRSNFVAGYLNSRSQMYRPFTISMFAIEWSLAPNDPRIGHFMNCLFYALTALVLFLVMCRIFVNRHLLIPFLATLLFVVHPIHTEVVANIKSRDELMSLFFSLLAFLFMFRYIERKKTGELFFAGIFYFAALMFKETAAVLLVIFPLLLYFFTGAAKKDYLKVMAFIAIPLVIQLLIRTAVLQGSDYNFAFTKIHNSLIDADGFGEKSASIFMLLDRYLLLLFFPHPLSSDYSYNQVALVNWSSPWAIFSLMIHSCMLIICLIRFRKKETWVFGIIFYGVTMFLFSNIPVMIQATIGERFLYTPSIGFCITIVALLAMAARGKETLRTGSFFSAFRNYKLPVAIVLLLSIAGFAKTRARNAEWKNNMTLYAADEKKFKKSAALKFRYGNEILVMQALPNRDTMRKRRLIDSSLIYLDKAIDIFPDYGAAYSQRGTAYFATGEIEKAKSDFHKAIYFEAAQWEIYNTMGVIYAQAGNLDSAMYYFSAAININREKPIPYKNLGGIYQQKNIIDSAIQNYRQALLLNAGRDQALQNEIYFNMANSYRRIGDTTNANYYQNLRR